MLGSTYTPVTVVFDGFVTSTMCISLHPAMYAYVLPSGESDTWTSAFPGAVSGLNEIG